MNNNMNNILKKLSNAFTLSEVLIATVIVGVIAALVMPTTISRAQNRSFDQAEARLVQTIEDAVNALSIVENKDFFKTEMYSSSTPSDYNNTSGKFIKKYLKVSRYCGNDARLCFPSTYYNYNGNRKDIYNPPFKGACAKLKNGTSICLEPQVGAVAPKGFVDLNGTKGPNVLGRDLREFTLEAKTQAAALDKTTYSVAVTTPPDLGTSGSGSTDPCVIEPNGLECCQSKTITSPADPCCGPHPEVSPVCIPIPEDPCDINPTSKACCLSKGITTADPTQTCCQYFPDEPKCNYFIVYVHDTRNGYSDNHYQVNLSTYRTKNRSLSKTYTATQPIHVEFVKDTLNWSGGTCIGSPTYMACNLGCTVEVGKSSCEAYIPSSCVYSGYSETWLLPKACANWISADVPAGYTLYTTNK